jgi:hypothetical protein
LIPAVNSRLPYHRRTKIIIEDALIARLAVDIVEAR